MVILDATEPIFSYIGIVFNIRNKKNFKFLTSQIYMIAKRNVEFQSVFIEEKSKVDIDEQEEVQIAEKPKLKTEISNDIYLILVEKLKRSVSEKEFLYPEFNLNDLSKKYRSNRTYLSATIKKWTGKNFNLFINDLRMNEAIIRLKEDKVFRSFTVEQISFEIGYASKSTFVRLFKERTGLTPIDYIKSF